MPAVALSLRKALKYTFGCSIICSLVSLMLYEFSWQLGSDQKLFSTSAPWAAEFMMRSSSDFPKRSKEIQDQFYAIYGGERGKFEELLRAAGSGVSSQVQTGIEGLMVNVVRNDGVEFC